MPTRRAMIAASVVSVVAPRLARAADTPAPWTDQGDVRVSAGIMHWASMGAGEPLVLMPKLGGWIADWRHVAPIFAQKYRVIAIDSPGHGGSVMNGPPPYLQSLPESAAMVLATLDALGVSRCAMMGNSLGGCIEVVTAGLWPSLCTKLILLSVALGGVTSLAQLAEGDKQAARDYDAEGRPLPRPDADLVKRFGVSDPAINDEQNRSRAKAGVWVRPSERGVGHAGLTDYLPRITAPTLLMYGEKGGYKQFEAVGKAGLKNVRSVLVPGGSSFAHQDQPVATARMAMEFLAA
ncbi:MAG: alpha/beta hydrolase [Rhodospirillaceae bacterium]|nr:alpha/beta hydrolase [Rhodospirillaceae bacterium]